MDGLRVRGFRHRRVLPDDRGLACIPVVAERSSVGRPGEQALHDRPFRDGLIHHSDRGVQYLSIRYTERLAEAGIMPSLGSVGDSYDNALAETIIGLYKTELIYHEGPWKGIACRVSDTRVGGLVQQGETARTDRRHPTD